MFSAAVLGCGRMGVFGSEQMRFIGPQAGLPQTHAEGFSQHPQTKLSALCEPDVARREQALEQYPDARGFETLDELLADGVPDLVGIATRTHGRVATIEQCIAAGVRALHVEKPICNSMDELAKLTALFARKDIFVTLGAFRRHLAPYRQAMKLAEGEALGRWTETRVAMGSAPLYWTHPHSIDLICMAAGKRDVESVSAQLRDTEFDASTAVLQNDPIVEYASVRFTDGFVGMVTQASGRDWHICGTGGEVSVLNNGSQLVERSMVGDNPYLARIEHPVHDCSAPTGMAAPIAHLVDCLSGDPAAVSRNAEVKRDILRGQAIMFAMVQSASQGGKSVSLDELDPGLTIEGKTGQFYA